MELKEKEITGTPMNDKHYVLFLNLDEDPYYLNAAKRKKKDKEEDDDFDDDLEADLGELPDLCDHIRDSNREIGQ